MIYTQSSLNDPGASSKFLGSFRVRGRDDNNVQFINIGRVGDKSFKELRWRIGGRRVGDNNFDFFMQLSQQKNATLKYCILGNFSVRIC